MKKRNMLLVMLTACLVFGSVVAGKGDKGPTPDGTADVIFARSDLFAAFLVAYEEQQRRWRGRGVDLSPQEFTKRHWAVHCSRGGPDELVVTFTPASSLVSDGAVIYIVDRHSLRIIETKLDR